MHSYLTIDKGKSKTVLSKMSLCLWICRDSKILKSVVLWSDTSLYYMQEISIYSPQVHISSSLRDFIVLVLNIEVFQIKFLKKKSTSSYLLYFESHPQLRGSRLARGRVWCWLGTCSSRGHPPARRGWAASRSCCPRAWRCSARCAWSCACEQPRSSAVSGESKPPEQKKNCEMTNNCYIKYIYKIYWWKVP